MVEHSRVEERFRWEWKLVFKKLCVDLSQGVEGMLLDQMQSSLTAELALWDSKHTIRVVTVDAALLGSRLEYPRVTSLVRLASSFSPVMFLSRFIMFIVFVSAGLMYVRLMLCDKGRRWFTEVTCNCYH